MTAQTQPEAQLQAEDELSQAVAKLRALSPGPTVQPNSQDWSQLDPVSAWMLINRHADNWADTGMMMQEYVDAQKLSAVQRLEARMAELEAAICTQHKENQRLRRNWCISYAGALAYMDDGEAQDNGDLPTINFLRDPVPEIEDKIRRRGAKQLAQLRESKLSDEQCDRLIAALCPDFSDERFPGDRPVLRQLARDALAHGIGEKTNG